VAGEETTQEQVFNDPQQTWKLLNRNYIPSDYSF
jgi:hypothetical protein